MPRVSLQTAGRQARSHHFIEDQQRAVPLRPSPKQPQKLRRPGDAAAGTEHRLYENRRDSAGVRRQQPLGLLASVVRCLDEIKGRVEGTHRGPKLSTLP